MIRAATAVGLAALAAAACAETPDRRAEAASTGETSDTSATSPMTVNPVAKGQSLPSTPPTLSEDPAQQPDDKAMPPGPVNPGA